MFWLGVLIGAAVVILLELAGVLWLVSRHRASDEMDEYLAEMGAHSTHDVV